MTRENMIMIGVIVLLVVVILVVEYVVKKGVNKGADAIHNARVRAQEKKDPPKVENLADRFKQPTDDSKRE